jgi:hypothetical protein
MQDDSRNTDMPRADVARPTPLQAVFVIAVLIPIVVGYALLGSAIGVQALFMGFLFSTYWGAVKMLDLTEYWPTAFGGLIGIGIAYLLYVLPTMIGTPGLLLAIAATIVPLYCMIRQQAALFLNPAFIVFLTVATIPALAAQHDYRGMVIGLLFGAAYARAVVFVIARLSTMTKTKSEPAAAVR